MRNKKKILFICELGSIHSVKWINQFENTDWEPHIAQGVLPWADVNSELRMGIVYLPFPVLYPYRRNHLFSRIIKFGVRKIFTHFPDFLEKIYPLYILLLILLIKPTIIHSLGLNINWKNYCSPVKKALDLIPTQNRPPWIYSTWGSDLDFYAKMSDSNLRQVESILTSVDYMITECKRDAELAINMGFQGSYLGALPAFGGIKWERYLPFRSISPVSSRKIIFLKGRDNQEGGDPVGRAMTAVKGFSLCKDLLSGYQIVIAQGSSMVIKEATKLSFDENINITILPYTTYNEILGFMGSSRIFISLTVNDGLPGSLVEAMALGAFPIHSDLSPIREWITNKQNGLLVPPEDSIEFAEALKMALSDDKLVDTAANINELIIKERLSDTIIKGKALKIYHDIAKKD